MTSIVIVMVLGVIVSVIVGQVLQRACRPFLDDVLRDERVSGAVANLLSVMFYLVALGTVAMVAVVPMPDMSLLYATAIKLGVVLLVLGFAHACVVALLLQIKKRRRRQILEEELAARLRSGDPGTPAGA